MKFVAGLTAELERPVSTSSRLQVRGADVTLHAEPILFCHAVLRSDTEFFRGLRPSFSPTLFPSLPGGAYGLRGLGSGWATLFTRGQRSP